MGIYDAIYNILGSNMQKIHVSTKEPVHRFNDIQQLGECRVKRSSMSNVSVYSFFLISISLNLLSIV